MQSDLDFAGRRERVLIQVIARWTGIDFNDDPDVNAKALAGADETYRADINDLDWQRDTLRRLGYGGPTL